ncbi:MAG TPA: hypothetical protein VFA20_13165 [Myxococcaceae bacterium]|nr:hypothetical protein [Myxococcaceae bacterium]
MVELIQEFGPEVIGPEDGRRFVVRAYAAPQPHDVLWDAWLVFFPEDGGPPLIGDRETSQQRDDLLSWASGLEPVYLEGALERVGRAQGQTAFFRHEPWGSWVAVLVEEERIAYRLARQRLIEEGRAVLSPSPTLEPQPGHA